MSDKPQVKITDNPDNKDEWKINVNDEWNMILSKELAADKKEAERWALDSYQSYVEKIPKELRDRKKGVQK